MSRLPMRNVAAGRNGWAELGASIGGVLRQDSIDRQHTAALKL